jgi:phage I-like protein
MENEIIALNAELSATTPDWVELIPPGMNVEGRDGRAWINDQPDGIVEQFKQDARQIPIDYEHATEIKAPNGEPAPAVAWIDEIEVRDQGAIWGKVNWNDDGRDAVMNRAYKYLSPVFTFAKNSGRVLRLLSAGLTNQPNLHLTALNRRDDLALTTKEDILMDEKITTALDLAGDSSIDDVVTAINSIKAAQDEKVESAANAEFTPDIEKFIPRSDFDAATERATNAEKELNEIKETARNAEIQSEIDAALESGKITPASVDYHVAACQMDGGLDRFKAFAQSAPEIAGDSGIEGTAENTESALTDEETAVCSMLGLAESEFKLCK